MHKPGKLVVVSRREFDGGVQDGVHVRGTVTEYAYTLEIGDERAVMLPRLTRGAAAVGRAFGTRLIAAAPPEGK